MSGVTGKENTAHVRHLGQPLQNGVTDKANIHPAGYSAQALHGVTDSANYSPGDIQNKRYTQGESLLDRVLLEKYGLKVRAAPLEILQIPDCEKLIQAEIEARHHAKKADHIEKMKAYVARAKAGDENAAAIVGLWGGEERALKIKPLRYQFRLRSLDWPGDCYVCGTRFMAAHCKTEVCSSVCARERQITISRDWRANRKKAPAKQATCQHCQSTFTPARADAKYCSGKCRVAAHRAKP